jgi:hypothetical protein
MSELGAGSGTSYPTGIDTDNTIEVNSPSTNKTKARAEVPNDLAAAIVAIETELGTSPSGTAADVKTFLQVQHTTTGTHKNITTDTISASGQITSTLAIGTAPLVITSTTKVTNLNADLLDGHDLKSQNEPSTVVARDASGNFAAGVITASLSGNATTSTSATTATTATTATNASGTGTTLYAAEVGLKIIRGVVDSTGAILAGSGFTVNHAGTGDYLLTWDSAFATGTYPAVVLTARHTVGAQHIAGGIPVNNTTFNAITTDVSNVAIDIDFSFIAIGPK